MLDVSHELRSPITRMKVALEFLPEGQAKDSLKSDIAEMETMINEILETARMHHLHGNLFMETSSALWEPAYRCFSLNKVKNSSKVQRSTFRVFSPQSHGGRSPLRIPFVHWETPVKYGRAFNRAADDGQNSRLCDCVHKIESRKFCTQRVDETQIDNPRQDFYITLLHVTMSKYRQFQ